MAVVIEVLVAWCGQGLRGLTTLVRRGWAASRLMVTLPGQERALRFVVAMLFAQRTSYVVPALVNTATRGVEQYRSPIANVALVALVTGWNIALGAVTWRRGWFTRTAVGADIVVTSVLLVLINANLRPGFELAGGNWGSKFAQGTAALIGAVHPIRTAAALVVGLVVVAALAVAAQTGELPASSSGFFDFANSCLWYALVLYGMRGYLCAQARAVDEAHLRRLAAETGQAADRARFGERLRQYRTLHDTVLTTLTAIARGGLDHSAERVRRRCATEADYIRRLVAEDGAAALTTLGNRLAEVAADAGDLGLRVRFHHGPVPAHLPRHVVDAVADAVREALNNVSRHAGVAEAWLTTEYTNDTLAVRIVDRGVGFDTERAPYGFGLRRSIGERMRAIGGELTVFSMVGEGTSVELSWSQPPTPAHPPALFQAG